MLQPRLPELCRESSALYTTCLAFQLSLAPSLTPRFFEYFDAALRTFRSELACSTTLLDGTLAAGLLLCSVGLMHGFPWTMHLEGMHNILLENLHRPSARSKFRTHLLEVMGVMDFPIFVIGRQTPCIGIWRSYCQRAEPKEGVEPVSGLPRSLLDLFAGIGIETTEQSFWDWPGNPGDFLQCYLWEAHRLAGILTLRQQARLPGKQQSSSVSAWRQPGACPADATILVGRILANLDALRLACAERPEEDTFIQNAKNYPLFVAGLEITVLRPRPDWQKKIRSFLLLTRQDELILSLLEEMWRRDDPNFSVDQVAQERGIEMGLL
ncbi:uncharacterized protein PFLUO_LOCUS7941 [Penicillium psychrofluorescens]|uniref:uncharacterized protein n=1 Tax=Penicillium psychrofluorescens TaxID=3158075 RepID=UPI003CCCE7E3